MQIANEHGEICPRMQSVRLVNVDKELVGFVYIGSCTILRYACLYNAVHFWYRAIPVDHWPVRDNWSGSFHLGQYCVAMVKRTYTRKFPRLQHGYARIHSDECA